MYTIRMAEHLLDLTEKSLRIFRGLICTSRNLMSMKCEKQQENGITIILSSKKME